MKTNLKLAYLLSGLALMTSCNSNAEKGSDAGGADTTSYPSVEKNAANTDYKPAFAGQTRVKGVKTTTPFDVTVLSKELKSPWGIAVLPDGKLLITEKEGTLRIASEGNLGEPIKGISEIDTKGQGGLLGVTVDPDFANNRMVYWTFAQKVGDKNLTAVGKGKLANDEKSIENAQVIYQAGPAYKGGLHYGSRILFDKAGNIVFSTGERSDLETRPQAQDLKSGLGKIIRITTDGKPATGNPFEGNAAANPEIYSYGHRNVQGLAFHPETGDLWETEFGPKGGDEVNIIKPGKNYGWPTITYGLEYSGAKIGDAIQQKDGMEQPVYYYDPVISPSGITFYSSNVIPEWKNNLFIAALSGTHIARLVIEDNKVVGEERLLTDQGQRFRAVVEGTNGELFAITDAGWLIKVSKK
ncbi:PQQ-dependent sugar dehydrogenase [Sphingobacterium sp. SYP-B4668]|uniref:PQQ-dependent sugar dehydrogenase n=1 Tax=Sphingobacterium sp. SYP-B4668 TaxID=2996035 RepID=UPI0005323F6A|nr:PQQ-dependent sugar dehydrogenase [Sphingobacterium sp. SYP-B4668]